MNRALTFIAAAILATAATPALAQHADHAGHAGADHGHQHADFESGRFHVRVDGPEQPIGDIILIPGLSSSPEVWDGLTEALKDRYRIHRIHVQGFAGAAAKAKKLITIGSEVGCATSGACVMSVSADPKVEIVVSRTAAAAVGAVFKAAFRMMIREV